MRKNITYIKQIGSRCEPFLLLARLLVAMANERQKKKSRSSIVLLSYLLQIRVIIIEFAFVAFPFALICAFACEHRLIGIFFIKNVIFNRTLMHTLVLQVAQPNSSWSFVILYAFLYRLSAVCMKQKFKHLECLQSDIWIMIICIARS